MARRRTTPLRRTTTSRRPQWMAFVTVAISLVNAIVRVAKMIAAWRKRRVSTQPAGRESPVSAPRPRATPPVPAAPSPAGSDGGIPDLFRQQRSDAIVQASGLIVKVLPDDTDDSDGSGQHQKFLVELVDRDRTTVKICHNLKFGRVPAREGEVVSFRGEYEYNERGGSVHWTHHDPRGTHDDGWIEIDGRRYG